MDLVTYWTIRDTVDADCFELGPMGTRDEAEREARRLRFPYFVFHRDYLDSVGQLTRAEQVIFRLPDIPAPALRQRIFCPVCGVECDERTARERANWRDFHEFENIGHETVELRWTGAGWLPVRRPESIQ